MTRFIFAVLLLFLGLGFVTSCSERSRTYIMAPADTVFVDCGDHDCDHRDRDRCRGRGRR